MPTRSSHTSWAPYFRFRTVSGCHLEKLRGGTYLILLSAASVPINFANSWLKETSSMTNGSLASPVLHNMSLSLATTSLLIPYCKHKSLM